MTDGLNTSQIFIDDWFDETMLGKGWGRMSIWRDIKPNEYIRYDTARNYLHKACQFVGGNGGLELKIAFDHEETIRISKGESMNQMAYCVFLHFNDPHGVCSFLELVDVFASRESALDYIKVADLGELTGYDPERYGYLFKNEKYDDRIDSREWDGPGGIDNQGGHYMLYLDARMVQP